MTRTLDLLCEAHGCLFDRISIIGPGDQKVESHGFCLDVRTAVLKTIRAQAELA
jgi:hypothetical protein